MLTMHSLGKALLPVVSVTALALSPFVSASEAIDAQAVRAAMASPGRLPADIERDGRSRPELVLPHLNLQAGATVVDLFGSGGYYAELLARVLGPGGRTVLHNNPGFEAWGANGLADRFEGREPGNIERHTRSGINLDLAPASLDGALIVMALHDLYVIPKRYDGQRYVAVGRAANVDYFYSQLLVALKPSGRFVVVDHAGDETMSVEQITDLHRMPRAQAIADISAAGFSLLLQSEDLYTGRDDYGRIVFDEDIQGQTDRFVLVFEKPPP